MRGTGQKSPNRPCYSGFCQLALILLCTTKEVKGASMSEAGAPRVLADLLKISPRKA
jgi:hypothetical protein